MGESVEEEKEKASLNEQKPRVKHDWTFFFFIALTSLLIAAAIAWVSVKASSDADSIGSAAANSY